MSAFVDVRDKIAFSTEKMRKNNLFDSERMFCDVYCFEPGQTREVQLVAYAGTRKGEIALAVHRMADGLMLRIRDFAPNVDPAKIAPRDLDDVRPGGLGTHFIRAVMDDASFIPLPDGEGNLLELVKRKR